MDPDDQKYVPKDHEGFNSVIKLHKGHTENEGLSVLKIGIVISNI